MNELEREERTMLTNEERREVAARLREQKVWDIYTDFEYCIGDICDAVFDDDGDLNDMFRLQSVLADLIEPEPDRTCKIVGWYEHLSRSEIGNARVKLSCGHRARQHDKFCHECGAKVVKDE